MLHDIVRCPRWVGPETPAMSLIVLLIILIVLFGGGGNFLGGGAYRGYGFGLSGILIVVLIVLLLTGRL